MRRASAGHVARYGSLVLETQVEDAELLLGGGGASGGASSWGNHGGALATLGSPSRCAQSRFLSEAARTRVPVQVVDMWVRYLSEVSTVDQTFKTAFQLDLRWPATARDEEEWKRDRAGFAPETVPCVEFTNAKEVEMERRSYPDGSCFLVLGQHSDGYERGGTVEPAAQGAGEAAARFVFMRLLVSGTFMCSFDLASFPFDVQTLPVSMDMSFGDASTTMFVPARGALDLDARRCGGDSFVTLNREFSALADFELERVTAEFACRTTHAEAAVTNAFAWGQLVVQFQIVRRWEGHVVRLAFLAFLLSLVSVASFGYDIVDSLNDRAGLIMNLVLANTAFQLVVSESLPPVPTLTLLERYIIVLFSLTVIQLCTVTLVANMGLDEDELRKHDRRLMFPAFATLTLGSNLAFAVVAYRTRSRELAKLRMGTRALAGHNGKAQQGAILLYGTDLLHESRTCRDGNAFISFASRIAR
jgi:hypothetical protein